MLHARPLFVLAAAAALARPAAAQWPVSLDAGIGPSFPFGRLATNAGSVGFNGLIGIDVRAPFTPVSLRVDGLYNEYDHTSSELGARQIWAISANAIYSFPVYLVTPYVMAGAGYYHTYDNIRPTPPPCPPNVNCTTPNTPTVSGSHFGIDGGAGLRGRLFGVGPGIGIGLFAEVRYQYYFGPHTGASMLPIIFGVTFPSVTAEP